LNTLLRQHKLAQQLKFVAVDAIVGDAACLMSAAECLLFPALIIHLILKILQILTAYDTGRRTTGQYR